MSDLIPVAVYGTLRRNLYNSYLMQGAQFIGDGQSVEEGTMYSRGGFPILSFATKTCPIVVELYWVDEYALRRLDGLEGYRGEGCADNWYDRSMKEFTYEDEPGELKTIKAFIYHQDKVLPLPIVESGDWATTRQRVL